ncbi:MAG: CDP-alcohol phosphatidyltransferase family protein, partial [Actinomycetota bacterium]
MTDGERWTRAVLADLRAARYTPRAWHAFLAASFARARATAAGRRAERRQVAVLALAGAAAWGATAATGHLVLAAAGLAWWGLLVVMLDWHLGMLERPDGSRVPRLGAANVLAALRAGSVPLLPALDRTGLAAALVALGITDIVDGPLARRRGEVTRLGAWLDGTADTLVMGVAGVSAAALGALPAGVAAAV